MKNQIKATVIAAIVALSVVFGGAVPANASMQTDVLTALNEMRPNDLIWDVNLAAAAQAHANVMGANAAHSGVRIAGFWGGENTAWAPGRDAWDVVGLWAASPGHRQIMMAPNATRAGVGYNDEGGWVLLVGGFSEAPAPETPAPVPSPTPTVAPPIPNVTGDPTEAPVPTDGDPAASWVPRVNRLAAADRFGTAVSISKTGFPGTAPIVYIASGLNYPDALGAAPAAAKHGGPLLLTNPTSLPAAVEAEIRRLKPAKIVVVGGTAAVNANVYNKLKGMTLSIFRASGVDRFETNRNLIEHSFPEVTPAVYVTTGMNFPDALSASAAGGANGTPVVLVPGGSSALNATTRSFLNAKGVSKVTIVGGPAAVSPGIETGLSKFASTTRVSGVDRFQVSHRLAKVVGADHTHVFIATGYNYPDALAGAALAGASGAPLYLVPGSCVPALVLAEMRAQGTSSITLLGGASVVTSAVASLRSC